MTAAKCGCLVSAMSISNNFSCCVKVLAFNLASCRIGATQFAAGTAACGSFAAGTD